MAIGKNRRTFCVVNRDVTESDYNEHSCRAGMHAHLTWAEVDDLRNDGLIQPVNVGLKVAAAQQGTSPRSHYVFEWLIPERVLRFKRRIPTCGQSNKLGWFLARAHRERRDWALAMVSQIREEWETPLTREKEGL